MENKGSIIFRRETGIDPFRSTKVYVDDKEALLLKENETKSLSIEPGEHEIRVEMRFNKSDVVTVQIKPGETLRIYIYTEYKTFLQVIFKYLYHFYFSKKNILLLKVIDAESFPERHSFEVTPRMKVGLIIYLIFFILSCLGVIFFYKEIVIWILSFKKN